MSLRPTSRREILKMAGAVAGASGQSEQIGNGVRFMCFPSICSLFQSMVVFEMLRIPVVELVLWLNVKNSLGVH